MGRRPGRRRARPAVPWSGCFREPRRPRPGTIRPTGRTHHHGPGSWYSAEQPVSVTRDRPRVTVHRGTRVHRRRRGPAGTGRRHPRSQFRQRLTSRQHVDTFIETCCPAPSKLSTQWECATPTNARRASVIVACLGRPARRPIRPLADVGGIRVPSRRRLAGNPRRRFDCESLSCTRASSGQRALLTPTGSANGNNRRSHRRRHRRTIPRHQTS